MNPASEKIFYKKNGYLIFNINDNSLIDKVNKDVKKILKKGKLKTNNKIYSYNSSPRIVESYKKSLNCKKLALHKKVIEKIFYLYGCKPKAFSTINFLRSTQQPLHSDYAHFGTLPELLLVGTWIALQDIDKDSGPLQVVPGSHKFNIYRYANHNNGNLPKSINEVKKFYNKYENWVKERIKRKKLKPVTPVMKKGDCIIWSANMLHGSPKCKNPKLSRRSQVTHWTFTNVKEHYNPVFSNIDKSLIIKRSVNYIR